MTSETDSPATQVPSPFGLVALLFITVFCVNLLFPRDLWVQDEARYGEVLREMQASGEWLVPHLNGFPYPDKPPLYFWVVAAASRFIAPVELAFRSVTLLSALAAVLGVYRLGRCLLGRHAAAWAGALFTTSLVSQVAGNIVRMDMLLTAATVLAWYALQRRQVEGGSGALLGFWVMTALAVATKGPIALLYTLLPAAVWLGWECGWRGLRSLHPIPGLLALLALAGLWAAAVMLRGQGAYLATIWQQQLVGRAVSSWSHREPVYFYIMLAPLLFMPWTGLVLHGAYTLYRQRCSGWRAIACFGALPLLGISLLSGKLFIYLEPLMPAVALAAAGAAEVFIARARIPRWLSWPPALYLLALAAGVCYLAYRYLPAGAGYGYGIGGGLFVLALLGSVLARANGRSWLLGWLGLSAVQSVLLFGALAWLLNPLYSARPLGELLAAQPPGTPVGAVNTTRGILNYYAGKTVQELDAAAARTWWHDHPEGTLIFKAGDIGAIFGAQGMPQGCAVQARYRIELKAYHVLAGC